MGKNKDIDELTNLMSVALRHKIGSIVNKEDLYASKYAKDAENIIEEARKIAVKQNWNNYDKKEIKKKIKKEITKGIN